MSDTANFDPGLHTDEARVAQLDELFTLHPDIILTGSLGRAAIVGAYVPLTSRESTRYTRDIDIMTTNGLRPALSADESVPFPVDIALDGLVVVDEAKGVATVRHDWKRPDVAVEMSAELFAPYPTRFNGQPVTTFHPDTMRRIQLICDTRRPKDRRSIPEFEVQLTAVPYTRIPDSQYEPLAELQEMVRQDRQLRTQQDIERLIGLYMHYVPRSVREHITPFLGKIRRGLGFTVRKRRDENTEQDTLTQDAA